MLEKQLEEIGSQVDQDRGAAELIRTWVDKGDVAVDEHGVPNVIGNRDDVSEQSMRINM